MIPSSSRIGLTVAYLIADNESATIERPATPVAKIVAVHVLPTNEVENIQLYAPTIHMFRLLHPFVSSSAKSTRRTNINAAVVAHM
ncbi:MAG: hypothetical protein IIX45_03565, partial [Lachnospiraceae bacterium]|nr:hypothetical protein [Lachnospiraceae bacterium]